MVPNMLFFPNTKDWSLVESLDMDSGNKPVRWFFCTLNTSRKLQLVKELMNKKPSSFSTPSSLSPKFNIDKFTKFLKRLWGIGPVNLLLYRSNHWREEALVRVAGMLPLNWFRARVRYRRLGKAMPISWGRLPCKLLLVTSSKYMPELLKIDAGIVPVRLLRLSCNSCNWLSRPRSSGIQPCSSFPGIDKTRREERFPSNDGMVPERWLPPRARTSSFCNEPKAGGTSPTSSL